MKRKRKLTLKEKRCLLMFVYEAKLVRDLLKKIYG